MICPCGLRQDTPKLAREGRRVVRCRRQWGDPGASPGVGISKQPFICSSLPATDLIDLLYAVGAILVVAGFILSLLGWNIAEPSLSIERSILSPLFFIRLGLIIMIFMFLFRRKKTLVKCFGGG